MIEWGLPVRTLGTDFDKKADALLSQIDKATAPVAKAARCKLSDLFPCATIRNGDITAALEELLDEEGAVL